MWLNREVEKGAKEQRMQDLIKKEGKEFKPMMGCNRTGGQNKISVLVYRAGKDYFYSVTLCR
jgi:hypothetical protein